MATQRSMSAKERADLADADWSGRAMACPACGRGRLAVERHDGDSERALLVSCRQCGLDDLVRRADDPVAVRGALAPWSDEAKGNVVRRHLARQTNLCPNCGTAILAETYPMDVGSFTSFRCLRCGQDHLHSSTG